MYKEFDIFNKKKLLNKPKPRGLYVVNVKCDVNDGDYLKDSIEFEKESFEEDELLMLILSYVSKYHGKFSKDKEWNYDGYYGHHVYKNDGLPWLGDYLDELGILLFASMDDCMCHSVSSVEIIYYDDYGSSFTMKLPDIDDLFETEEEFNNYVNDLYNKK